MPEDIDLDTNFVHEIENLIPFLSKTEGGDCANFLCSKTVMMGVYDKNKKLLYCLTCFKADTDKKKMPAWREFWDGKSAIKSRHALNRVKKGGIP